MHEGTVLQSSTVRSVSVQPSDTVQSSDSDTVHPSGTVKSSDSDTVQPRGTVQSSDSDTVQPSGTIQSSTNGTVQPSVTPQRSTTDTVQYCEVPVIEYSTVKYQVYKHCQLLELPSTYKGLVNSRVRPTHMTSSALHVINVENSIIRMLKIVKTSGSNKMSHMHIRAQ